jgi:hypothetical protein
VRVCWVQLLTFGWWLQIPGIAGTVLDQKLQGVKQPHPRPICSSTEDWLRVWLRVTNLVPVEFDCFANTISMAFGSDGRWHEKAGVQTRVPAGLRGIDYLDDASFITRRLTRYFELTTEALNHAGYQENQTLFG